MECTHQNELQPMMKIIESENYYTSKANGSVKLRESFGNDIPPVTIPEAIRQVAEKLPENPALRFRRDKEWETITYKEYYNTIRMVAKGFLKLGLERYHSVCILGMNSPEWFISNLAAIMAGGFAVGIYLTNSPEACLHNMKTSLANIVVVENDEQLQKILKVKHEVPTLKCIIQYTGSTAESSVLNWHEVLDMGVRVPDNVLDERVDCLAVNQCCSVLFTSGTTSLPKAAMLSHDNLIFTAKMAFSYYRMEFGCERIISYLPLNHIAGQMLDLYFGIVTGACIYFADKNALKDTFIENLVAVKPTFLISVPRLWEKINEFLETSSLENGGGFMHKLVSRARQTARTYHLANLQGRNEATVMYKFYSFFLYSRIKEIVGLDKCKFFITGSAPLARSVRENLMSFDICLGEIYGMTESSGLQVSSIYDDRSLDYCGVSMPNVRTKIYQPDKNGEGEICFYGRNIFMGYLNNEEQTQNTIDKDYWLHSGDLGNISSTAQIRVTGRIKEILITVGGENIAPVPIEMKVKDQIPIVSQAVLIAEAKKFVTVLITLKSKLNPKNGMPGDELLPEAKKWCKSLAYPCDTISEIIQKKPAAIYDAIQQGIDRVNSQAISRAQKIQKFTILPKDFSYVTGEMNRTLKLVRTAVYEKYKDEIDRMYST